MKPVTETGLMLRLNKILPKERRIEHRGEVWHFNYYEGNSSKIANIEQLSRDLGVLKPNEQMVTRGRSDGRWVIYWHLNGRLHRDDGPAVELHENPSWYLNGVELDPTACLNDPEFCANYPKLAASMRKS